MSDLKKSRAVRRGALAKAYGDLGVLLAEDEYDAAISERENLKMLYLEFKEAHTAYHVTLQEEADVVASDAYFSDVQQLYITQQNTAKGTLHGIVRQQQISQEVHTEQSFKTLSNLMHLPPLELKKFSGEPDEFDNFVATFNEIIGNVVSSPAAKLVRLKSQLTGMALESVKMCCTDSGEEGYTCAMNILRDRFGSPYMVCNSIIERLKHGAKVRTPAELRTLSDELANAQVTLKKNKMYNEIDTQNNILEICLRLESCLRYKWRDRIMQNKQSTGVYLDFSEFVIFVQEQADTVNDPLYGRDALEDRPNGTRMGKSISSLPVATQNAGSSIPSSGSSTFLNPMSSSGIECHMCCKNHKLYTCYKFRNMSIDQRHNYVKTNKLCTLCLSKAHSVSSCRSNYRCRINNCGERHSSSMHVYNDNQTPNVATGNCTHSSDTSNVYMPTVPVVINETFHTFAILDTGSSASFCSRRMLNKLKLQGSKISYQLQTLHGSNSTCSKAVNIRTSSKDGTASLNMNNVMAVDNIPVARCSTATVSEYPHLRDLTFTEASHVDLLIGQDNSAALVPHEVRRGPVGSPFQHSL